MDQKEVKLNQIRKRLQTLFFVLYGIILLIVVFYSYAVLKVNKVTILDKQDSAKVEKITQVNVKLALDFSGSKATFDYTLTTDDTVLDLLKAARKAKKVDYEITEFTNGLIIDEVNTIKSTNISKWTVLLDGKDITKDIRNTAIIENGIYTLTLSK